MAAVENSILGTIKKLLGIDDDYTVFDEDIKIHINSVFSTLQQLGVGPTSGYKIDDKNNVWVEFTTVYTIIESVKTYVYLKVRLVFDPPTTSFAIAAIKEQITELEWRLNTQMEEVRHPWTSPTPE